MKFRVIMTAFVLMTLCSCKSQFEVLLNSNDVDAKYKAAFEYFENKKYSKAASLFESLSVLTEGTEKDDTVKYYWGLITEKITILPRPTSSGLSKSIPAARLLRKQGTSVWIVCTCRPFVTNLTRRRHTRR